MGVEGIREGVGDLNAQALKNSRLRKAGVRRWMLHAEEQANSLGGLRFWAG
jgi:hypothetical protein